jgi:CHASE2 domain-containing sensor protein
MGDIIRTPDGLMPGVEYQANMLESLRRGSLLVPLGFSAQFVVGAAMLALPCLLYGLPGLRRVWRATAAGALLALAASLFLLRGPGWWWPPAACVLTLAIALAGWGLLLRWPRRGAPAGSPA